MKKVSLLFLIPLAAILYSCEPEFKDEIVFEPGEADFRNYVAIGNSLTAGFQSNALSREGQINSYPAILAQQFAMVEEGMVSFRQPLLPEGPGVGPVGNAKLVLGYDTTSCTGEVSLGPVPAAESGQKEVFLPSNWIGANGPYYNLGVPGITVAEVSQGGLQNLFYLRFATDPSKSILTTAVDLNPTFFSLWIGNNDVLSYATEGGEKGAITDETTFRNELNEIVDTLVAKQAEGVIANVPAITSVPFFNTIPWNGLTLDANTATQLNFLYKWYNDALDAAVDSDNLSAEEAESREIHFTAGANAFVIVDNDMTDLSAINIPNYRQIRSSELLTLRLPLDQVKCNGLGSYDQQNAQENPITEDFVLDEQEIDNIENAIDSYNRHIEFLANTYGLALVDTYSLIKEFERGVSYDGVDYSTEFVTGGLFSLDGVHPNSRGYAIIANAHIDAINAHFNANIPKVNVNDYVGTSFP